VTHTVILASWEDEIRRILVQGQPVQIVRGTSSPKWTGGVAKVVEHLLCKLQALSSTLVPPKKKKIV
jgi:hypothetical protein